jgi:hypothetical protein
VQFYFKLQKKQNLRASFFRGKSYVLILTRNEWATSWRHFHKLIWPPWLKQYQQLLCVASLSGAAHLISTAELEFILSNMETFFSFFLLGNFFETSAVSTRVARWVLFNPKIQIRANFGGP